MWRYQKKDDRRGIEMKKNILLLIVAFIFTFCFVTEVDAYCSTKKHNALKALAFIILI